VARHKNPRTLLIQHTRALKSAADTITHVLTFNATRTVWDRPEGSHPHASYVSRPRQPKEHVDNRPELWLQARGELIDMSKRIQEADLLLRFKLATLGRDYRGVDIGAREALGRLNQEDVTALIALEVWDGSLPQVP